MEHKPHALKDPWFVYYIPAPKEGEAYGAGTTELDYVRTIEEAYGVINTLPNATLLPADDEVVFSRNKIPPNYESFPNGDRISIFTKTKGQSDEIITMILAAVLGEAFSKVCGNEHIIDVLRIAHKPGMANKDALRLELWAHESHYTKDLEKYINSLTATVPGVSVIVRKFKH